MKSLLLILLLTATAQAITPCQIFVIQHWPRYNFSAWAIAAGADTCEIETGTLADAADIAEAWVNGQGE